jgi:subtilisin family serine protease
MPSGRLGDQLDALGVANAFVFLKGSETLRSASAPEGDVARLRGRLRLAPKARRELEAGFVSGPSSQRGALAEGAPGDTPIRPLLYFPHLGVAYGAVTSDGAEQLEASELTEGVVHAPALRPVRPVSRGTRDLAAAAGATWGIQRLGVEQLWASGITGRGVLVAHLDTGADGSHPALFTAIVKQAFFDMSGQGSTPAGVPMDTGDHGTHTGATIAGRTQPGAPAIGVAPGAHLLSAIVIEKGDLVARVLGGLEWALAQSARVVNLSVGIAGWDPAWLEIFKRLRAQQLLPVVAAGNDGRQTSSSPANYPQALSVGAIDPLDQVPEFSSSHVQLGQLQASPELCAPGTAVLSAAVGGGYREDGGTSQAAPHISGLAALLMEAKPAATVDQVEAAILGSCALPTGADPSRIGRGVPDAGRALGLL